MPTEVDKCVEAVMKDGKTETEAYAICNAAQKKATLDAAGLKLAGGIKATPFEYIDAMMWSAFDSLYWETGGDYWVQATFADSVIAFNPAEGLKKFPYTIENGKVLLGDPIGVEVEYVPIGNKIYLKRTRTGVRWMSVSSNVEEDLYSEHFTADALKESIAFSKEHKSYGELRMEHHPASRAGVCDGQLFFQGKLIETGTFDDTQRAKNLIKTLMADTKSKYKVSVGFLYDPAQLVDGAFLGGVRIFERSVTDHPANVKTAIGVVTPGLMEEEVKIMVDEVSRAKLIEMVGEEEAAKIIAGGEGGLKAANIRFKAEEEHVELEGQKAAEDKETAQSKGTEDPNSGTDRPAQANLNHPNEIELELNGQVFKATLTPVAEGSQEATPGPVQAPPPVVLELDETTKTLLVTMTEAIKSLQDDITNLKSAVAIVKTQPDAPRAVRYRATLSPENVATPEEAVSTNDVSRQKFFRQFAGGTPVRVAASKIQ